MAKIEDDLKATVAMPDVRGKLENVGMEMRTGTAEEMKKVPSSDVAKWAKLVRDRNLQFAQ